MAENIYNKQAAVDAVMVWDSHWHEYQEYGQISVRVGL